LEEEKVENKKSLENLISRLLNVVPRGIEPLFPG
jgi:hypothetical protein